MTIYPLLREEMLTAISEHGGFVNCHAHFDKAFYIRRDALADSMVDMQVKWRMSDDIKRASSEEEIAERIRKCLDIMVAQGVRMTATFVDAYDAVEHKAIDAVLKVREEYRGRIDLMIATQPLGGLVDAEARALYEAITSKADIAGGLPSKDRPDHRKNLDVLFSIAKNLDKPLHVHIDQENNPDERDTEVLVEYAKKYGYEGRVIALHAISTAAQPLAYRKELYKRMADVGMAVVVCPSAALSMRQLDSKISPVHNSIANVPEMLDAGIVVGLGVDNMSDYYHPFVDGDLWIELRMLQEACRFYDFDALAKIASENGKKILAIR
ncbi:amidohydrolase family protein [Candidatus Uhrbacteria bacterium]|nr:amidohydrolase family protein [Candidatus Uhrbacteria bacterium]